MELLKLVNTEVNHDAECQCTVMLGCNLKPKIFITRHCMHAGMNGICPYLSSMLLTCFWDALESGLVIEHVGQTYRLQE